MKREHYLLAVKARKIMNQALNGGVEHSNGPGCDVKNTKRSKRSCACMGIVTPKYVHLSPNQACHAGLSNTHYDGFPSDKGQRIAVISSIQTEYGNSKGGGYESFTDDELLKFIDWLINRSPYAKLGVFVNNSAKDVLKNGFICNTDVPSNIMAGGLIASRVMWEYTGILSNWLNMVDGGIDESVAFYAAHAFDVRKGAVTTASYAGHCALSCGHATVEAIKTFRDAKPTSLNKNYVDSYYYDGVHAAFQMGGGVKLVDRIDQMLEEMEDNAVKHVFHRAEVVQKIKNGKQAYTTDGFIKAMKEIFHD